MAQKIKVISEKRLCSICLQMPLAVIFYYLMQGVKERSICRQSMLRLQSFSHKTRMVLPYSRSQSYLFLCSCRKTTVVESSACVFSRLESAVLIWVGKTIKHEKDQGTVRSWTRMQAKREALILKAKAKLLTHSSEAGIGSWRKKGLILRQEFAPVLPKSELIPTRQHCVSYAFEVNRRCKTWLPQLSPVALTKLILLFRTAK